jgi:PAS domain S-box-containing protein
VRYEDLDKDELICRLREADRVVREYRAAQETLRQSEDRFRALVQASSDVVYRMSPDWTEMRQLVGRDFVADTDEPSRTWLQTYIHPDDQPEVTVAIQEAIRTRSVFERVHRVLRVDGCLGWTFSRAIPMFDGAGEITEWIGTASDITKRKAAEAERERLLEEVQAERDRMAALLDSMRDEVWFADAQGRFTLANAAALKEFGLVAGGTVDVEQLAATLRVLRPDGSLRPIEETPPLRALRGETVANQEEMIRTPASGELRYRQVNATPVRDGPGRIIGAVAVVRDVTEQKAAAARLRASETYLRLALEASSAASWAWDVVGGEIVWDDNFRRLYGFPPGSDAGWDDWVKCLHPDDRAAVMARLHEVLQTPGDDEWNRDFRIVRPDGQVVWMQALGRAERDADGHATRLTGINLDISRRKAIEETLTALTASLEQKVAERTADLEAEIAQRREAEVALRASEARLQTIFQQAPIGITQADPANGRLLMVNPAYCAIVGYNEAELIGLPIADITHPEDRAADGEAFRQLVNREIAIYAREKRYVRKDGGIVWVRVTVSLVRDAEGRPLHTVAMIIDITALRQAEEAAREHLDEASRLQRLQTADELATLLAHELNQPLATIATYAEVGERLLRVPSPDPEKMAVNLKRISEQALRAGDIIRHLRGFVSRGHFDPMPMDLHEGIRSACTLIAPQARRSAVRLETQLDSRLPPVMGVAVQVEQVLLNLVRNAVEAIQEAGMAGGSVTVRTQREGSMARVTVSDSGPGIDADAAARLFQPLASRKVHGLGVGLRISRSLIEAHGGRLWVEPRTPGGCFHFELPLAQ